MLGQGSGAQEFRFARVRAMERAGPCEGMSELTYTKSDINCPDVGHRQAAGVATW